MLADLATLAAVLVAVGAALGAFVRDRRDAGIAFGLSCIGVGLLFAAAGRLADGAIFGIIGLAGLALLWSAESGSAGLVQDRSPFEAAVAMLGVVGGIALALNHPLLGRLALDVTVDVLVLSAVVALIPGSEIRMISGVNRLLLAGITLLVFADPDLPRAALLLFGAVEIGLAAVVASWSGALSAPEADARAER